MAEPRKPHLNAMGATSIGADPGSGHLDSAAEQADPMRNLMKLAMKVFTLGEPTGMGAVEGSQQRAGVGGLPEGLNPQAIAELLKRGEVPSAGAAKAPTINNGPNTGMFHDLWESMSNGASDMMTKRRAIPLAKL